MEVAWYSKRWYPSTVLHDVTTQKGLYLNLHCCENFKSRIQKGVVLLVLIFSKKLPASL